jgi:hypothetical protein
MSWLRRMRWWILVLIVGSAAGTVAMASSLNVASNNLTAQRTCVVTSTTTTAGGGVLNDYVDGATANQGTNNSASNTLNVQSNTGKDQRTYILFDLTKCTPSIPTTATVTTATMRLDLSGALPNTCRTHDVFKVTSSWSETTLNWTNQPFGTTINNPATAQRTTSANVGKAPCTYSTAGGIVEFTVTADVQAFVSGTSTNNGWMIRDDSEGSATAQKITYTSKHAGVLGTAPTMPQLVVSYVTS